LKNTETINWNSGFFFGLCIGVVVVRFLLSFKHMVVFNRKIIKVVVVMSIDPRHFVISTINHTELVQYSVLIGLGHDMFDIEYEVFECK
jgi:hypothetical protein